MEEDCFRQRNRGSSSGAVSQRVERKRAANLAREHTLPEVMKASVEMCYVFDQSRAAQMA